MKLNLNTKVNIIKNNNLKVTYFELLFPFKDLDFDDYYNLEILCYLLSSYSFKYKSHEDFVNNNDYNYIGKYNVNYYNEGDTGFISCSFLLPGDNIFNDFNLEKSLKTVRNNLFKGIVLDIESSSEIFNQQYERYKTNLLTNTNDPKRYLADKWAQLYDFKSQILHSNSNRLENLKKSSIDRIIELYNTLILKGNYISFISGNISSKEKYEKTFDKIFRRKLDKFSLDVNYDLAVKPDSFGHVDQKFPFSLSYIRVSYRKFERDKKDKYLFFMLNMFLNRSENRFLFYNLRLENNLIYSCNTIYFQEFNSICLEASLSRENIDKALRIFDETLVMFKDKETFESAKERFIKGDEINLLSMLDDKTHDYKLKRMKILKQESFEEEFNIIKEITYEEFSQFIDDLNKDSELILIGDKND